MATTSRYLYSDTELEAVMQNVKHSIVAHMVNNDIITKEVYEDWSLNYAILLKKPSFFAQAWSKFGWKDHKDALSIIIVKQSTMIKPEPPDDKKQEEKDE